jgi:hypothetical protein
MTNYILLKKETGTTGKTCWEEWGSEQKASSAEQAVRNSLADSPGSGGVFAVVPTRSFSMFEVKVESKPRMTVKPITPL